jgi:hypothetical protein
LEGAETMTMEQKYYYELSKLYTLLIDFTFNAAFEKRNNPDFNGQDILGIFWWASRVGQRQVVEKTLEEDLEQFLSVQSMIARAVSR